MPSLLLVEDNPDDAELTQLLLQGAQPSWTVEVVASVKAAVARLQGEAIDLVLMDMGLPDGVGAAAVQRVIAAAPNLPVVVMSGSDYGESEALRAGARVCLVKGKVDAARLQQVLGEALRARDAR
jgi:CheY-like chemotaxis protein